MTSHDSSEIKNFLQQKSQNLEQSSTRSFLALDSSTQLASVAVSVQGKIIFAEECLRQKSHSEWISGALERAIATLPLSWKSLELVSLVHGPGSFTGLRVATNVARTIAYVHSLPVVSMSSLEVLGHQVELEDQESILILPMINAFKNMVFYGLYYKAREEFKTLVPPQAGEVDQLAEMLKRVSKGLKQTGELLATECSGISRLSGFLFDALSEAFESPNLNTNKNSLCSKKIIIVGDGVESYKNVILPLLNPPFYRPTVPKDFPLATTLAERINQGWKTLPIMHWKELKPVYLRASAAEELALSKKTIIFS